MATALGDALVGLALAHLGRWPSTRAFWLVPASLGVYHGAMALNDWADREADAREGRPRPIPQGEISPPLALCVALTLMLGGVAAGFAVAPAVGAWMAGVATLAAAYDLFGRGPYFGPLLLGACRAGNLAAGAVVARSLAAPLLDGGAAAVGPVGNDHGLLWVALTYGMFIFGVSSLARLEDGEDQAPLGLRPQRALSRVVSGVLFSVLGVFLIWPTGTPLGVGFLLGMALSIAGAATFVWRVVVPLYGRRNWTRAACGQATGTLLRSVLLLQAAWVLPMVMPFGRPAPLGVLALTVCLAGYPMARALRRVFPPT